MKINKPGPLNGLRVLDLAGPIGLYCTKQLAEMGADVVKIEPPGGDPTRNIGPFVHGEINPEKSLYFFYYNTNKRSITLNLETEKGREIFKKLVKSADIVVETYHPGYLEKLGLGYDNLRTINRGLIMTSITGFGQNGPYCDYQWSDLVGLAMGGIMILSGFPDDPPNYVGGYQAYNLAGTNGAIGTLMALCYRDANGEGQHVDVSMQEAVVPASEISIPSYAARKIIRRRSGRQVYRGWNELFPCKDGYIMCSPFGAAGWRKVLAWVESEGMAADLTTDNYTTLLDIMANVQMDRQPTGQKSGAKSLAGRDADIAHIEEVWEQFLMTHTKQELFEKCQAMNVRLMPIYNAADQMHDPQLLSRDWFTPVEHPELGETIIYGGPPYRFSETPWRIIKRSPFLGEHNQEVYEKELGFSPEDLISLEKDGVV
jgi:crotonobetainyl-CoA:carnitine CoA-transferase CaiB-like acyl-CoA transferase